MTAPIRIALGAGLSSAFAGVGMIFANFDAASFGVILTGVGTLITAAVGAYMTILNGRAKARENEMRLVHELKMKEIQVQVEATAKMSQQNNTALMSLHQAVADNTLKTVEGTAAAAIAADQAKQRVEQLAEKLPVKQSETEEEQTQ